MTETVTEDEHGNEIRTLDKTYNEIVSAETVRIRKNYEDSSMDFYVLYFVGLIDEAYAVAAMEIFQDPTSQAIKGYDYTYYSDSADGVLSTRQSV